MAEQGRLSKSLKNARVALFFMILTFLINFLSRKFFLDGLGPELMGMRTTLSTVLGMLTLSELGIGLAVNTSLHKPLVDKDYKTINEIVSLLGWLYRWVFTIITLGIIGLMFYLPTLFEGMTTPILYAYLTLGVSYVGTMLSYTVNYKSVILNVDQKSYKVSSIMSTASIVKNLIQLAILRWVPNPYIYWIAMDLGIALLGVYILDRVTRKEYPWLELSLGRGREYLRRYPEVIRNTKQLSVRQLCNFVMSSTTPWFVFKYVGLTSVTFYDNYKNIIANVRAIYASAFTNDGPAIANLIAEGDRDKTYSFFWEMYALKQFISGVLMFGIFTFATPFVGVWLGEQYQASALTLALFCLISHLDLNRGTIDSYVIGYKLFADVWAPLVEGGLMILFAILLGRTYGLNGLLVGTLLSQAGIHLLWRPYYLYTKGFERSPWLFFSNAPKFYLATISLIGMSQLALQQLDLKLDGYILIFAHAAWTTLLFATGLFASYYILSEGFRKVSLRLYNFASSSLQGVINKLKKS